ncbi:hypothetical protein A9R01_07225, partial ['Osedax' symbiont bacterium Rs2_46_30_T18]
MSESNRGSRNKKLVSAYLESLLTDVDELAVDAATELVELVESTAELEEAIIDIDSLEVTEGVDLEEEARNLLAEVEEKPSVDKETLVDGKPLADKETLVEEEPLADEKSLVE